MRSTSVVKVLTDDAEHQVQFVVAAGPGAAHFLALSLDAVPQPAEELGYRLYLVLAPPLLAVLMM